MWLWECQMRALGFRRKSDRYWQCQGRHELPADAHLSVFSWSEQLVPTRRRAGQFLVELTEFHVTFCLGHARAHFYYHDRLVNDWQPGGHTSARHIARLGHDARRLRSSADAVAVALAAALGGVFRGRRR